MFDDTLYNRLLQDIFTRFPSVQKTTFKEAYKPGLSGMLAFAGVLGNPQEKLRLIHVAGTNGKGSVSNMLASALCSCGYRTGLYTSPHILDFRERMRIDGEMVPKEYVYDFILKYKEDFERIGLSFFEITTGMALKWFADSGVDAVVMEVGLGGRLDSTNIISPVISIITSIGLDHCDLLGHTLSEVASEKAGIIKPGVPCVIGEVLPETRPVFETRALAENASLVYAQEYEADGHILEKMDLRGGYQAANLRTVLCSTDILKKVFPSLADETAVADGIIHTAARMHFHGRWERLSEKPLTICDIGHNAHALKNNFLQLEEMRASGKVSELIIVYGIMADKDLDAILPLMPVNAVYIFTTPSTNRAMPAEEIYAKVLEYRRERYGKTGGLYIGGTVADAVALAREIASGSDIALKDAGTPCIYIGGSNFVVAEAVTLF